MSNNTITDKAIEILRLTNDGNDLAPEHLKLMEMAVNDWLNDLGMQKFEDLFNHVINGYKKPWLHGVENLTIDNNGFVYWRNKKIEHFNIGWHMSEDAKHQSIKLGKKCLALEGEGKEVNCKSVLDN